MFEDLSRSQLTYTNPNQTKSSPSVYSDNDGSFNSEENLRWMTKKIAQKPFIVGKNTEDVNNNLQTSGAPYGLYVGEGLFNIDGYLFKVSPNANVSYDNDFISGSAFVANSVYAQRFVGDLIHYGKQGELKSEMSQFCFSNFLPTPYGLVSVDTARDNWKDALDNNKAVGFIQMIYENGSDYLSAITPNEHSSFDFIYNDEVIGSISSESVSTSDTPDQILTDFFSGDRSNCYPIGAFIDSHLYAYYPVYVRKSGETAAEIYFTDVFGLTYTYGVQQFATYSYPSTVSNILDMDADVQDPFENLTGFDKTTFPSKHYHYERLYDNNTTTRKTTNSEDISGSPYYGSDVPNVVKYSIPYLTRFLPAGQTILTSIENNLSYYCLPDSIFASPNEEKRINRGTPGNDIFVPVAIFTSEGSLCTDGLIVDGNTCISQDISPVESYIHFIKRNYLEQTSNEVITEDAVDRVTLDDLNSWSGFTAFYNTYLSAAMSSYLNLCYDSLLDNVFYNTGGTDALKIKAHGAGNIVGERDSYVRSVVTSYMTYYTVNNQTATASEKSMNIYLEQDTTSDYYKANRYIIDINSEKEKLLDDYDLYIYSLGTIDSDTTHQPLRFEDPIEFIKNCIDSGEKGLSSFNLKLPSGYTVIISETDKKIKLDDFLVPVRVKRSTVTSFNFGNYETIMRTRDSISRTMANSLSYSYYKNTWEVSIPSTISVCKDSLKYLRGRDYDDSSKYDGLEWNYKLPCDVTDDELYVFDLKFTSNRSNMSYDTEQCIKTPYYDSESIRVRREAFIHISKIYGDNNKGFEECVGDSVNTIISESVGEYELNDVPRTIDALIDHIDYGTKNQIQIIGNPRIDGAVNEWIYPDIMSNVKFRYNIDTTVFPYRTYIEVGLNSGTTANRDTSFVIPFNCSGGDLCLTGCPDYGNQSFVFSTVSDSIGSSPLLIDYGNTAHVDHAVVKSGLKYYTITINTGAEIQSGTYLLFYPMLCSYPAYLLTDKNVACVDSVATIKNNITSLEDDVSELQGVSVSTVDRPTKNLLCRSSGEDQGYFISKCLYPIGKGDYVLTIGELETSDLGSTQVRYELLDKDMVSLYTGLLYKGTNIAIPISRSLPFFNTKEFCYIRIGYGWDVHYDSPVSTVTVKNMMLCKRAEYDESPKYFDGLGNLADNFISLCDRSTKNLLTENMIPSETYPDSDGVVDIRTEYVLDVDDYILYLGDNGFDGKVSLLDNLGNESHKYDVTTSNAPIIIPFIKDMLNTYNLENVRYVRLTPNSGYYVWTNRVMLCRSSDWNISSTYVPSVSSISAKVYSKQLESIKETMGDIIDVSHKNLYTGSDINESSVSYVDLDISDIHFDRLGEPSVRNGYVLKIENISSSISNGPYDMYILQNNTDPESQDPYIELGPFTLNVIEDTNSAYAVFYVNSTDDNAYIRIYAGSNHASTGDVSCSNIMICTRSFYEITNKYVPYSPTNAELYDMIQNL